MSKLCVHSFAMSIDGYGAGPNQSLENPLGAGGLAPHEWAFATKTFQQMFAKEGGATGVNDDFVARGFSNIGAWIFGRNMFGPWPDANWKGWWGDNPPYHTPVFVLTHHARESFTMEGGTTFHFVTDGIHSALQRAVDAANGLDVRLGGGVATIKQYLRAALLDEMHVAIAPVLLGAGQQLFSDIDMPRLGYRCVEYAPASDVTHVVFKRAGWSRLPVPRVMPVPGSEVPLSSAYVDRWPDAPHNPLTVHAPQAAGLGQVHRLPNRAGGMTSNRRHRRAPGPIYL